MCQPRYPVTPLISYVSRDLTEYREKVVSLATLKTGELIYNGSAEHASIVIECLFKHAQDAVQVFTGRLSPGIFATYDVVWKAMEFLDERKGRLEIVVENSSVLRVNPFVSVFRGHDNVEIKEADPCLSKKYHSHFTIADSDGYRFEKKKSIPFAVAAFGDKESTQHLAALFLGLWQSASTVNLS